MEQTRRKELLLVYYIQSFEMWWIIHTNYEVTSQ